MRAISEGIHHAAFMSFLMWWELCHGWIPFI